MLGPACAGSSGRPAARFGTPARGVVRSGRMLLTLHAACLKAYLKPAKPARGGKGQAMMSLADLPAYTADTLGLTGLNMSTALLAGADPKALENLRESADRRSISLLLLTESEPQPLASDKDGDAGIERMGRVLRAARLLGCPSVAMAIKSPDDEDSLESATLRAREIVESAEKLDINVLLMPCPGLTEKPERMTEVIKRIGGFRIGTFPDFQTAAATKDGPLYIRRLAPYAQVICASTEKFSGLNAEALADPASPAPTHASYDLGAMVKAAHTVGYDNTLSIDYRGPASSLEDVTMGLRASAAALREAIAALSPEA